MEGLAVEKKWYIVNVQTGQEAKAKVEQEKQKLRSMNPATASLKDIESIIADADKLSGEII